MNKWVIIGVVVLLVLGVVIGGYYVFQSLNDAKASSSGIQDKGLEKAPEIPSEYSLKLFDALKEGLS